MGFMDVLMIQLLVSGIDPESRMQQFPDLIADQAAFSIAVVKFLDVYHLEQFERCSDPNRVCMDPPPLALETVVLEVVGGADMGDVITVATTDHYGAGSYERMPPGSEWLIKIESDGTDHIMPRYSRSIVRSDVTDTQFVEVREGSIWWLPCSITRGEVEFFRWEDPETEKISSVKGVSLSSLGSQLVSGEHDLGAQCEQ